MNILVYLGHPAQFHFIKNAITLLKSKGHSVILLIKTKDVLEQLVQQYGFKYINIQQKSRKNNSIAIILASFERTLKVLKIARRNKTDILIGTDSSVAQAAYILGKHAITTLEDDYEVISKLAKLTYPFTSSIVVPKVCSVGKWEHKKVAYEGYMKLAYLHPKHFQPDNLIVKKYIQSENYCLIRLARLTAHHDVGINGLNIELVKNIIEIAEKKLFKVYISSEIRLEDSLEQYNLKINQNDMHHLMSFASLLISDSQSMSVEAAMLGVPSIRFSDFAGKISVLEELESKYNLTFGVKTKQPEKLLQLTELFLSESNLKSQFQERRKKMLSEKIDVTSFFVWFIENFPESYNIMCKNPDYQYNFK